MKITDKGAVTIAANAHRDRPTKSAFVPEYLRDGFEQERYYHCLLAETTESLSSCGASGTFVGVLPKVIGGRVTYCSLGQRLLLTKMSPRQIWSTMTRSLECLSFVAAIAHLEDGHCIWRTCLCGGSTEVSDKNPEVLVV